MIKTKKGNTRIVGKTSEIMADLTCILKAMRETLSENMPVEKADAHIDRALKTSRMSEEDVLCKSLEQLAVALGLTLDALKAEHGEATEGCSCCEDECSDDCEGCMCECSEACGDTTVAETVEGENA